MIKFFFLLILFLTSSGFSADVFWGWTPFATPQDPKFAGVCCIQENGRLDVEKFTAIIEMGREYDVDCIRSLPFLVSENGEIGPGYMPWVFRDGKYDLDEFNPVYFDNLRLAVYIANEHGITWYQCLFDNCHGNWPNSPWVLNHQEVEGWYDLSPKARHFRQKWVCKVIETLTIYRYGREIEPARHPEKKINRKFSKALDFGISLANEPDDIRFVGVGVEALRQIRLLGVPPEKIILGARWGNARWFEIYQSLIYLAEKFQLLHPDMYRVVYHGVDEKWFDDYRYMVNCPYRQFISDDGLKEKLTAYQWHAYLSRWLFGKWLDRSNDIAVESLCAGYNWDAAKGIKAAFMEAGL